MRIQRYVKYRFLGTPHFGHKNLEILDHSADTDLAVRGKYDFIGSEDAAFRFVYLFAVVADCTI